MKHFVVCLSICFTVGSGFGSVLPLSQTGKEKRETVLDRVTHIDKDLHLEVSNVPRLCDELSLKKQRINVGDCELYVEDEQPKSSLIRWNEQVSSMFLDTPKVGVQGFLRSLL
jgi:hypothetical protein